MDALEMLSKLEQSFEEYEDKVITFTSSIPYPVVGTNLTNRERFETFMHINEIGHPLLWLPKDIIERKQIDFGDGNVQLENDAIYYLRLAIQLQNSELYDKETGLWLDVLKYHGFDPEDDMAFDFMLDWSEGLFDDDNVEQIQKLVQKLDTFDISSFFKITSEQALTKALEIYDRLTITQWKKYAKQIKELLADDGDDKIQFEIYRYLSDCLLANAPVDSEFPKNVDEILVLKNPNAYPVHQIL